MRRSASTPVRTAAVVCATLLALLALAGPASAHGRGAEATNFASVVTDAPAIDGVRWEVRGNDAWLTVGNTSGEELVVEGYRGEPYLRVGPDGVFENQASEATYLNRDRHAQVGPLPADVGPDVEPRWQRISDGSAHAWHDHRIHYMGVGAPPAVTDPQQETLVQAWAVPFAVGGRSGEVRGELRWIPGPSPWPWLAAALAVTAPAAIGLLRLRRRAGGSAQPWVPTVARPAAAVVAGIALLNTTHLVDDLLAVPLPPATKVLAAGQTLLFLGLAAFGALRAWQGRDGAFTALGVGAAALLLGQGVLYASVLGTSQEASVFPSGLTRAVVALSVAQALPVGWVAVAGNRRLAAEAPPLAEPVSAT